MPQPKTPQKDPFADYQQPADPFSNYQEAAPVSVVPVQAKGLPPLQPGTLPVAIQNVGHHLSGLVTGPYHAFTDEPKGEVEQGVFNTPQGGRLGLGLWRLTAGPTVNAVQESNKLRAAGGPQSSYTAASTYDENGNNIPTAGSKLVDAIPIIGPWSRNFRDEVYQKGVGPAVAGMATDIALAKGLERIPGITSRPVSKSITTAEEGARNLAKALAVPELDIKNFVRSAADEAGTIRHYAAQNGLPINSTLDFANAAKAAKTATADFYENNLLKPVENKSVSVGPKPQDKMTLRDIDSRVVQINKELNPAYRQKLQSQTGHMLASEADLLAEQKKLNTILNRELGQSAGVIPETVSEIRTKLGKLGTVADIAESSANRDLASAGKAARGESSGIGGKESILHKGAQWVRGGPVTIGNRATLKALEGVQPQPLILPRLAPTQEEMLSSEALRAHRNTVRQQRGLPPL